MGNAPKSEDESSDPSSSGDGSLTIFHVVKRRERTIHVAHRKSFSLTLF